METIKKGSKGEDVKILQKALGLTPDGIFGVNTEKAVIEFQKKNKLTADGIVGKGTWSALGLTTDSRCIDPSVVYSPLSVHITSRKNRTIKYLVIHFTAGSHSEKGRALNTKNTFISRKASADFCVDDETMVQFNPDIKNYYCWSVGDTYTKNKGGSCHGKCYNNNSISIEMCSTCKPATQTAVNASNHSGWTVTEAVLENTRTLAKIIMKKYDIPIERVIRHYDVSGKLCPGIIGWNNEPIRDINGKKIGQDSNSKEWENFKESLKKD